MATIYEGMLSARGRRFAIVLGRFNSFLGEHLLSGAIDTLRRHGCADNDIEVYKVPGAYELPMMAQRLAKTGNYHAIIGLGVLIRGATPHFDYISSTVASGLARVARDADLPVTFGVLTTDTLEQAIERSGTKAGNKGEEATMAAIEMAGLFAQVPLQTEESS